jgi:hypothetical protein
VTQGKLNLRFIPGLMSCYHTEGKRVTDYGKDRLWGIIEVFPNSLYLMVIIE